MTERSMDERDRTKIIEALTSDGWVVREEPWSGRQPCNAAWLRMSTRGMWMVGVFWTWPDDRRDDIGRIVETLREAGLDATTEFHKAGNAVIIRTPSP